MITRKLKLFQLFQKIFFQIPVILFTYPEIVPLATNLEAQALNYESIFPVFFIQEWITGTVIYGDNPIVILQYGTSSISGKPASEIIFNWFRAIAYDN